MNRRKWLQLTGLAGSATLLSPSETWAGSFGPNPAATPARLCYNENPFGPSEMVKEAVIQAFMESSHQYPFARIAELQQDIAEKEGVDASSIVVTGGSTEGLKATGLTYGWKGGEIVSPDPTYLSLLSYAEQFGAYINKVPLNDKLEHDLEEMDRRVTGNTRLVFVCNPNNPTGTLISKERIEDFCESLSRRTIVFSDEAYGEFITEEDYPTMTSLVKKGANVIVSRTFSKVYGLAGLRVGYLIARPDIANRIRPNAMASTNMLAVYAAKAALKDQQFYNTSLAKNLEAKEYMYELFDELGLKYVKSHTNFVFFHSGMPIGKLIDKMKAQDVQVGRPFPPLTDWCRISTGQMNDVMKFGEGLKKVFA